MSKHQTLKKLAVTTVILGTAMHAANEYMNQIATSKNLLKKENGTYYSFKYGNLFYKISGEGKPVILIHDINECSSGMEWFYLEKKLSKTQKVYTIDLIGCGRSDKPLMNYNAFVYVQMISDFIKDVVKEPADIIATGKSAAPVIMAAKLNGELIDRIMLINPTDLHELEKSPNRFSRAKRNLILCPVLGTFIYQMLHTNDRVFNRFVNDYFSDATADFSEILEYYYESAHRDKSGSKYLYASLQGRFLNLNIAHGLKSLEKDIIILSGEDFEEASDVPEAYAKLNENIECISIMDTSYLPQLEAPAKVMDILSEYWK